MKKIITFALILVVGIGNLSAQELFKQVLNDATTVVNDPKSNDEQIQINQFKVTVLNYIVSQVEKQGTARDSYFYDSQAVNMVSFITDFNSNLIRAKSISEAKRLKLIETYRDASLKNPLFNDADKKKTFCYVNDPSTLTPFSLDTDWEKAYEIATKQVKELFK